MARNVYVVLRDGPDGPWISGVYSTEKKAQKAIKASEKEMSRPDQYTWEIDKQEVQ